MNEAQELENLTADLFDVGRTEAPVAGITLDRTTDNGCGTQPACNYPQQ